MSTRKQIGRLPHFAAQLTTNLYSFTGMYIKTFLDQLGDQGRPAGLVAGAEPLPGLVVEVFIDEEMIPPEEILLEYPFSNVREVRRA
jgi:hypothetical protein